jgi:hypothetical protein
MSSGTSLYQARIRRDVTMYAAATEPLGPETTLDVIANNLDHYADSFGQVRMCFAPAVSAFASKSFLTPSVVAVDTWYQITASAAFPLPLMPDGTPYKLRGRLGGASSGGHAVKFAMVLAPVLSAPGVLAHSDDATFITATTSSSTAAWLTGTSQGTAASGTLIEITPTTASACVVATGTPVDLSLAGSAIGQCLVSLTVFGSTANLASTPRLCGAFAAEWPG